MSSGYQYTQPRDLSHLDELGEPWRTYAQRLSRTTDETGDDLADLLAGADIDDDKKAMLAEAFTSSGAFARPGVGIESRR